MQLNKKEFIAAVHQRLVGGGNKKDFLKQGVEEVISAAIETIKESVANGDKIVLVDFGSFEKAHREAKAGRNPKTGEPMEIPAKYVPKFTAGKNFKDIVAF